MDKTILLDLIKRPDPTIVEIGAHHGEDSEHFLRMWPKARLLLVEPDPRCIKIIKKLHLKCDLFEGVLSDLNAVIDFQTSGPNSVWDGSGSIMKPKKHLEYFPQVEFGPIIQVPSLTLDMFCYYRHLDVIDFIWADVQGAEERVINGGLNTFRSKVRYFYTEYCQDEVYEGCPKKERILDLLQVFDVISDVGSDVCGDMLLRNRTL